MLMEKFSKNGFETKQVSTYVRTLIINTAINLSMLGCLLLLLAITLTVLAAPETEIHIYILLYLEEEELQPHYIRCTV